MRLILGRCIPNEPLWEAGSTIPEETSVRRYSTSSSEGNGTDLEASFASVNQQPPPIHTGTRERATSSSSKSPMATATRSLANTFGFMRDSFTSSASGDNIWTAKSDYALDTRMLFKRKITTSYISLTSLKSYVEVNYSGFRKILKKCVLPSIPRNINSDLSPWAGTTK